MANRSFFLRACQKVNENKKSYQEKAQETKQHSARLVDMQRYVDLSEEKRNLLIDIIKNGKSSDSDETLLEKGVIIYCQLLDVVETLRSDLESNGIECYVIQGSTKESERGRLAREFKGNPNSKVVLITDAAGESLNLQATNEIILYNVSAKYNQIIGRIVRNFSKFEEQGRSFYIHYVITDETIDEYKPILLSTKKELEEEILHADTISLKETGSFNSYLLKEIRKKLLWKTKKKK